MIGKFKLPNPVMLWVLNLSREHDPVKSLNAAGVSNLKQVRLVVSFQIAMSSFNVLVKTSSSMVDSQLIYSLAGCNPIGETCVRWIHE